MVSYILNQLEHHYKIDDAVEQKKDQVFEANKGSRSKEQVIRDIIMDLHWSQNRLFSIKHYLVNRAIRRYITDQQQTSISSLVARVDQLYRAHKTSSEIYASLKEDASLRMFSDLDLLLVTPKNLPKKTPQENWKDLTECRVFYDKKRVKALIKMLNNPPKYLKDEDETILREVHAFYKIQSKYPIENLPKHLEDLFEACDRTQMALFSIQKEQAIEFGKNHPRLDSLSQLLQREAREKFTRENSRNVLVGSSVVTMFKSLLESLNGQRYFRFSGDKNWHQSAQLLARRLSYIPTSQQKALQQVLSKEATDPFVTAYRYAMKKVSTPKDGPNPKFFIVNMRETKEITQHHDGDILVEYVATSKIREGSKIIGEQTLVVTFTISVDGEITISEPEITDTTVYS